MIRHLLQGRKPQPPALIEQGRAITYGELAARAGAVSRLLAGQTPAHIALLLPDGSDYVAALWGVFQMGHTAFPLSVQLTGAELGPLLAQAGVDTVITLPRYRERLEAAGRPLRLLLMDALEPVPGPLPRAIPANPHSPMLLLATSGTTGGVKIVQLSQRNVEASCAGYLGKLRFGSPGPDAVRYTLAVPFSSVYGIMILTACLSRGFPLVVPDAVFTLDGLFQAAEAHRITHFEGSATAILLMERLAGRAIPYDIRTLTYFGFGGSKVAGHTIQAVLDAYPGVQLYQGYGMTEAAPLIAKHPQGRLVNVDSVGTAIAGVQLAVERDGEITRVPGVEGEILVRGPNVMQGYLNNAPQTAAALKNRWLYTGDLGYVDGAGYLYISGRKKSLVIVRGFKVQPEEVEACILSSGLASDCLVYGMEDAGVETLCAQVVPTGAHVTAEDIGDWCAGRLADYKVPLRITLAASLPKGATGKTERRGEG